ncbi:hypothetical protein BH24ACT16_BH24ACT16_16290 [soil metagenome]
MVTPPAGAVALVTFPFSDLSNSKLRPAIVLAEVAKGGLILCQIISNPYSDTRAIEISESDFSSGSLRRASYARPGKLFTANHELLQGQVGMLKGEPFGKLIEAVVELLRSGTAEGRSPATLASE